MSDTQILQQQGNPSEQRWLSAMLWLTFATLIVFVVTFMAYVHAEKTIDREHEKRQRSFFLASELRQSSDDLTQMVRTYVVTGNPVYKRYYQEILDIRDGIRPRPLDYHNVYWSLALPDGRRPTQMGEPVALLTLMHKAGFSNDEFAKLAEAKANSDILTATEFAAMALIESTPVPAEQLRKQAVEMLYNPAYLAAKAKIMAPIREFITMADARTLGAVRAAEQRAAMLRLAFLGISLCLLCLVLIVRQNQNRYARQLALANRNLDLARHAAEEASRAKSTFLANMSHELRTPLNAIMGMNMLALRHAENPRLREQLEKIGNASRHLLHVINDVLDISKIEAERLVLGQTDFRLAEVIDNVVNLTLEKLRHDKVAFLVDIPDELLALGLVGDPMRLGQVLLNLTSNAVKFTDAGHVSVRCRIVEERGDQCRLRWEVEDTGIGIAVEDQGRLFFSFEQADSSMTRQYGGTGLGLAISKRLVQLMGGEIGLASEPGKGSTFWFSLWQKRSVVETAPPSLVTAVSPLAMLQQRHACRRVLLVEDEPINQEVGREILQEAGMRVDVADDGEQALHLARENHYDLILMDIQMPRLNGIDATRLLRQEAGYAEVPILAVTANAFEEDRRNCLDAGMNDHVSKPIEPDQLYEVMLAWLDRGRTGG